MSENETVVTTEAKDEQVAVPPVQDEKSEIKKVLDEMHKWKKQARELEDKMKSQEVNRMKESQNWQQLAEVKEREALELDAQLKTFRNSVIQDKKLSAVRELALASGLRKEAMEDLDLITFDDTVTIETTSNGRILVNGADRAVQKLKAARPHWFTGKAGTVNGNNPEVINQGKITYTDVEKELEKARKSGNFDEAQKMLLKFKQQN